MLCLGILAVSIAACSGSKKLGKKGDQLLEAGMYTEAATYYYNALLRNQKNIDAKIGLKNTGQRVFDDKLAKFTKAKAMEDHKAAVYAYQDALAYRKKLNKVGVELDAPGYMADDFNEAKAVYLDMLYRDGTDQVDGQNFDAAQKIFKELIALEPNYKDVDVLNNIAMNEPHYREGKDLMEAGDYRGAYYEFDKVYQRDRNYKQTPTFREECLEKGKYPVAISPFENASGKRDVEKRINAYVITELSEIDNPFLKVVDRAQMEAILEEQRLGMSGVIDEETAAEAGNLLGAQIMITGTVLSYTPRQGKMQVQQKNGYESYQVKRYDKANDKTYYDTKYKAVKYKTYTNRNEVLVSFQYKAISLESGEILFSKVVEKNLKSDVHYATYSGEVNQLYPAGSQGVNTSNSARKNLQKLIRANRNLKSIDQLSNEAYSIISSSLSEDVLNHLNSL